MPIPTLAEKLEWLKPAPATPYVPVVAEMSRTVPSPNIDIGIRPMTAAAEKRQAPGIRKISA